MAVSLSVKIGAQTEGFVKSLKEVDGTLKGFSKKAVTSFSDLQHEVYRSQATFKNLAATIGLTAKETQNAQRQFLAMKGQMDAINNSTRTQSGVFANLKQELTGSVMSMLGWGAVIGTATTLLKGFIESALDEEKEVKKITFALDGNKEATERTLRLREELRKTTIFTESEISAAMAYTLELGHSESEMRKVVEVAMALSNLNGKDLQTNTEALTASYTGNVKALGKIAVEVKGLTAEQYANGAAVDILKEKYINLKTQGLDTTSGKITQLKKEWGELGEGIGGFILNYGGKYLTFIADLGTLALKWVTPIGGLMKLFKSNNDSWIKSTKDAIAAKDKDIAASKEQLKVWTITPAKHEAIVKAVQEEAKALKDAKPPLDIYIESMVKANKAAADLAKGLGYGIKTTYGESGQGSSLSKVPSIGMMGIGGTSAPSSVSNPAPKTQETGGLIGSIDAVGEALDKISSKNLGGFFDSFKNAFSQLAKVVVDFGDKTKQGILNTISGIISALGSMVEGITSIFLDADQQKIDSNDAYYDKERTRIEESYMSQDQKTKALEKLDKEHEKKRKELMIKQAKDQKTAAIIQAAIAGALAVVTALSAGPVTGIVLAAIVGALAAVQIAMIASQPLPSFAEGGLASAPTMAVVGDNPNASMDPEVIAPLSKLKGYMKQVQEVVVKGVIRGKDIFLVSEYGEVAVQRTRGY